jgi:hypothetical protein
MVFDAIAEKERDVDVTVTYRAADGAVSAFVGREVKAHTRPLTVEDVEQLCAKYADMPSVTHGGIVSASGYTDGGKKKARGHGVELFHIEPWIDNANMLECVRSTSDIQFETRNLEWVSVPARRITSLTL